MEEPNYVSIIAKNLDMPQKNVEKFLNLSLDEAVQTFLSEEDITDMRNNNIFELKLRYEDPKTNEEEKAEMRADIYNVFYLANGVPSKFIKYFESNKEGLAYVGVLQEKKRIQKWYAKDKEKRLQTYTDRQMTF